jgi:hypothetical protein
VWTSADGRSRYSNTLLVSLNNRIYFRDHSYPGGRGSTQCHVDSSRTYPSAVSSLTFAHPGLHSHTASIGDNLRLGAIPSAKVIDIGKSLVIEESIDARCVLPSQNLDKPTEAFEFQSCIVLTMLESERSFNAKTSAYCGHFFFLGGGGFNAECLTVIVLWLWLPEKY